MFCGVAEGWRSIGVAAAVGSGTYPPKSCDDESGSEI